jgi:hypothetical protein
MNTLYFRPKTRTSRFRATPNLRFYALLTDHLHVDLVVMNRFETTMERWHDFYITAGGAAAVLLGLLFVSLSLHLNREASEYGVLYRVGTQAMIDPAYALAFAFLMLIPISDPTVLGGVLLVLSVGGALDSLLMIGQRGWLHGWTYYVSLEAVREGR